MMTIAQLLVWSQTIPTLISAGIMVEQQVAGVIKMFHPTMTDPELNAIVQLLLTSARGHLALAQADEAKP